MLEEEDTCNEAAKDNMAESVHRNFLSLTSLILVSALPLFSSRELFKNQVGLNSGSYA
jgi:hypothetical protein